MLDAICIFFVFLTFDRGKSIVTILLVDRPLFLDGPRGRLLKPA